MPVLEYFISGLLSLMGVLIFKCGFNRMHKCSLIKETPSSKIQSIAGGLVEIHGQVQAKDYLFTPFSQSECVYYRYEIQEYRIHKTIDSQGKTSTNYSWDTIASDEQMIPFWAKDETGEVYVKSTGAEFNLPVKRLYLQKARSFGTLSYLLKVLKAQKENKKKKSDISWNFIPLNLKKKVFFNSRVGDRRFYEYYLESGENLFVIGTAVRTAHKVLIKKGKKEPTFMISNQSEKELFHSLKWQMIGCFVFGSLLFLTGIVVFLKISDIL